MIHDYDRSHWFGASDARYVMDISGSSKTWNDWWLSKCGLSPQNFHGNIYTKAGNTFEHSILKTWHPGITFDRQIIIPELRLRVNLDGNTSDEIIEVKTYQIDREFKVTDGYYYQTQMQMLAWKLEPSIRLVDCDGRPPIVRKNMPLRRHIILAYGLYPDEYYAEYGEEQIENGDIPIDKDRIKAIEVKPSMGTMRRARKNLKKLSARLRKEEV